MPEIRDIYDAQGERTGRTFAKGEKLAEGEYFLHVIVLIRCRNGQYLLQQRALNARHFPGEWDVTGGGVQSGESSRDAGVREVLEELGLRVDPRQMVYGGRIERFGVYWLDMWGVNVDAVDTDCRIDPREVNAVRMAGYEEFERVVMYNKDEVYMGLQRKIRDALEEQA